MTPHPSSWQARFAVMLPLAGYVIWIAESVFAPPNPIWALLLFLWALSATLVAWWITRGKAGRIFDSLDRHASSIAIGMIIVAAIILVIVSCMQALYFVPLGAFAEDTAYYSQVLWNTLHGDFLSGNVQQERLYNPPVLNDLALHVSPVLVAGILPIYALFQHFLILLVIRDIILVLAAWPLFLLAREKMGGTAGVAAVVLYLANPAVITQGIGSFGLLQLAPLPFFGALRTFLQEDLRKFLCWMAIALSLREEVAIAMAGFGLWALVRDRRIQWWGLGLGISIAWWGLTTLLIQPAFGRGGNFSIDVALAGGNQDPMGIYQSLLGRPSWILDGLRDGGLNYLYRLLRPVAFLGILGREGLLALPALAANLFLGRVYFRALDPVSRFALLPSCALIGATVVIINNIVRKHARDMRVFTVAMLLLLPSVSLLDGAKDVVQDHLTWYAIPNEAAPLWEAVARIPGTASVAAPDYALPALSKRPKLYNVQYIHMYPEPQIDYFLLDLKPNRITTNPKLREFYVELVGKLLQTTDYENIWEQGEYLLLRRRW